MLSITPFGSAEYAPAGKVMNPPLKPPCGRLTTPTGSRHANATLAGGLVEIEGEGEAVCGWVAGGGGRLGGREGAGGPAALPGGPPAAPISSPPNPPAG